MSRRKYNRLPLAVELYAQAERDREREGESALVFIFSKYPVCSQSDILASIILKFDSYAYVLSIVSPEIACFTSWKFQDLTEGLERLGCVSNIRLSRHSESIFLVLVCVALDRAASTLQNNLADFNGDLERAATTDT